MSRAHSLEMLRRVRLIVALGMMCAVWLASAPADAQTTGTSGTTTTGGAESVNASGQLNPDRIVNGQDLGQTTRPQNLNPTGISYSDCISNMSLRFSVLLSGFIASDSASMQIWASRGTDCTAATNRGIGGVAVCWPLGAGTAAGLIANGVSQSFDVRVQDIVGPQNESPTTTTYQHFGQAACSAQPTSSSVPMTIWFLPLNSVGTLLGTAYQYPINTDLVGPPPPVGVSDSVGDTLFNVSWTPSVDADTAGYDVFIDPIPGQEGASGSASDAQLTQLICPDATVEASAAGTAVVDGAGDEAGDDAAPDDAEAAAAPASSSAPSNTTSTACYYAPIVNPSLPSANGTCTSTVLTAGIVIGSGAAVSTQEFDEAGNVIDSSVVSTGGGISTIPAANIVGLNAGATIASESSGNFTIVGLTNGVTYNVAVAAVDGSGNIGPASTLVCDSPAPVVDFWNAYRNSGGLAGGGFCALEAVGLPVGPTVAFAGAAAGLLAIARRRRRGR
jgi:hypothetical protein